MTLGREDQFDYDCINTSFAKFPEKSKLSNLSYLFAQAQNRSVLFDLHNYFLSILLEVKILNSSNSGSGV